MSTEDTFRATSTQLLAGLVLAGVGIAAALETNTGPESLSILVLGCSAVLGLVAGIADDIDPLRRALERGYWLLAGLAMAALLALVLGPSDAAAPLVIGFALAFGAGVVASTVGSAVATSS